MFLKYILKGTCFLPRSIMPPFSPISTEAAAWIEPHLDHIEICSLIFLLYDNVEIALQDVSREMQLARKHIPVLDSALFRVGEYFHEGVLARWARSCVNKEDHWQDKLLEALLIVKNYQVIKLLGRRKQDLDDQFYPSRPSFSLHVALVRKVLYLVMDDLTNKQWSQLQNILINEAKMQQINVPILCLENRVCFLLFLMSRNVLNIKTKPNKINLQMLISCLKRVDLLYWAQELKDVENFINGKIGPHETKDYSQAQVQKRVLPPFDLDPSNPGTILIFNLENYDEEYGETSKNRKGSDIDCQRLEDTFRLLGFQVITCKDPTSAVLISKTRTVLEEFCKEARIKQKVRCFVLAILAHGDKDGVLGKNGVLVKWESFREEMRRDITEGFPRLLLIQACKGISLDTKASDECVFVDQDGPCSDAYSHSSNLRNFFELSASVSGYAAFRSPKFGSFFIHSFCHQILSFGSDLDLQHIVNLINIDFEEKYKNLYVKSKKRVTMTAELSNVTATKALFFSVPKDKEADVKRLVRQWHRQLEVLQENQLGILKGKYDETKELEIKEVPEKQSSQVQNSEINKKSESSVVDQTIRELEDLFRCSDKKQPGNQIVPVSESDPGLQAQCPTGPSERAQGTPSPMATEIKRTDAAVQIVTTCDSSIQTHVTALPPPKKLMPMPDPQDERMPWEEEDEIEVELSDYEYGEDKFAALMREAECEAEYECEFDPPYDKYEEDEF